MSAHAGVTHGPLRAAGSVRSRQRGMAVRSLLPLLALAWLLAGCSVPFGCCVDVSYSYWVLNDSAQPVTVDYRGQLHFTITVPPHTYGGVGEERSLDPTRSLAIVDAECHVIQTWPLDDASHRLLYISPAGERTFVDALAWEYGAMTAKQADLARLTPPCP